MTRKGRESKANGWIYAVQWKDRAKELKIGFASSLKDRLVSFLTYSSDTLVVLKAFHGTQEDERDLHKQFERQRINGEWFTMDEQLKNFFKMSCPCDTKEARQEFGTFQRERIIWRNLGLEAASRLENAHQSANLPRYIKTASSYVLWAVRELNDHDFLCTPNAIITNPVNNVEGGWQSRVIYDESTIYNRISLLAGQGLIAKGDDKLYTLTAAGVKELEKLELQHIHLRDRQSVRPLYPRMAFDRKPSSSRLS